MFMTSSVLSGISVTTATSAMFTTSLTRATQVRYLLVTRGLHGDRNFTHPHPVSLPSPPIPAELPQHSLPSPQTYVSIPIPSALVQKSTKVLLRVCHHSQNRATFPRESRTVSFHSRGSAATLVSIVAGFLCRPLLVTCY